MAAAQLLAACALLAASSDAYVLTDESGLGPRYAGIGGLSGGGATSRLLPDYDESTRAQILDLLFKPQFGASLQLLKVEIGGDGQSTEGTEPSHAHFAGDRNFERGYEWMLLREAKARNPDIGTLALSWSWPAWVGCPGGDLSSPACDGATPYTYPSQAADYVVSFVEGARDAHNVSIDIVSSWNEKSWSSPFLVALRESLDAAGLNRTRIVCDDFDWSCAQAMATDPALFAAVDFISGHDDMPAAARVPGKPLYDTEGFHTVGSDAGAASWIHEISSRYVTYGQTMNIAWNLVAAYSEGTAFWPHGLMHAFQPWQGWYSVPASIWATAHYTQFTQTRSFHYTLVDAASGGSGALSLGGTYVSLVDDRTGDFTLVVEKMPGARAAAETATFTLGGRFAAARVLAVWSTKLGVGGALADPSEQFVRLADVKVAGGAFAVDVAVGQILTVTTLLSAGFKGGAFGHPPPPPPAAFPAAYSDSFDDCAVDAQAKYVTDFNGVTTCEESGDPAHGVVMRQVVPKAPIRWWTDTRPHAVVGDPTWADVDAAVDFRCTNDGAGAMIGARASIESPTYITDGPGGISAEDNLRGLWFSVACAGGSHGAGGAWALWPSVGDVSTPGKALARGTVAGGVPVGSWHTLRLVVNGSRAEGFFDGAGVFDADVSGAAGVPAAGFAGFGTLAFGDYTQFDNIALRATAARCSAAGAARSPVAVWPCNAMSPGQQWVFATPPQKSLSHAAAQKQKQKQQQQQHQWAAVTLASNTSLCLTVSDVKNKYGSFELIVDACAAAPLPPVQLFSFNAANGTLETLGGGGGGGNASVCVDVTANDYSVGNALNVFACQQSANQRWRLLAGGLLSSGDPAEFYCAGACA
jgi:galactosylceramidase